MEENKNKKRVLFVCLGNICRSPAAEGVFKTLVERAGKTSEFVIDSAGTSGYHQGELPDARMRSHAQRRGYNLTSLSRQIKYEDFDKFDYIIAMDDSNYDNLCKLAPDMEGREKIHRMAEYFTQFGNDHVPDPYYGGSSGFELVLDLLEDGCAELLRRLTVA